MRTRERPNLRTDSFQARWSCKDSSRLGSLTPYTGVYIDWSGAGGAFDYDQGPSGNGFFSLHRIEAGQEALYTGQQQYHAYPEAQRLATGNIGGAEGDLLKVVNGAVVSAGIHYVLVWSTARQVVMTLSGGLAGTFTLTGINYEQQDDDAFLPGTWALTAYTDFSVIGPTTNFQTAAMAVVSVTPASPAYHFALAPHAPAGTFVPPSTARLYVMNCVADELGQGGATRQACRRVFGLFGKLDVVLWFDPVTRTAGMEAVQTSGLVYLVGGDAPGITPPRPQALHIDLQIAPDAIRGHGVARSATASYNDSGIAMQRIPDGTTRDSTDYPKQ
jgi:hypothetical protein